MTLSIPRKLLVTFITLAVLCTAAVVLANDAFGVTGLKRDSNQAVWDASFTDNQAKYGFPSGTRGHIRDAMDQWDSRTTGADFHLYERTSGVSQNAKIYTQGVKFSRYYELGESAAQITQIVRNNRITFSTINLNREWDWTDSNASCEVDHDSQTADVRIVLVHEGGHTVRLEHDLTRSDTVMNPDDDCDLRTTSYDKNEVIVMYGEDE